MAAIVAAAATKPNPMITPEIAAMVGTSPPKLLSLSSSAIQRRLGDKSLDIGMCGYFITQERMALFDYSNPFYFASGLQAVVPKPVNLPTFATVFTAVVGTIDDRAQLIAFVLLLVSSRCLKNTALRSSGSRPVASTTSSMLICQFFSNLNFFLKRASWV